MKFAAKLIGQLSIIAKRFTPFVGQQIRIRPSWDPKTPIIGELLAIEPVGKAYFVHLRVKGRSRFVNSGAILELALLVDEVDTVAAPAPTSETSATITEMIG